MSARRINLQQREFEQKIGYDAALQQHVGNEIVHFDWLRLAPCGALPQWKVAHAEFANINIGNLADSWVWYYRKQNDAIKVSVESYRNDNLGAMTAIGEFSDRSNMVTPPYARGPKDIGTISLVLETEYSYELYWAYRNLKFEVGGSDKAAVTAVAHCLQDIAIANTRRR